MGEFYREGRLADDLPRLIMANVQQFSAETRSALDELMQQSRTGWLDSHPCASGWPMPVGKMLTASFTCRSRQPACSRTFHGYRGRRPGNSIATSSARG